MGAWGAGNFENDDAADWVYDFEESPTVESLAETLKIGNEIGNEYLEAPNCCRALAAAEVVAAINGSPHPKLSDELKEILGKEHIKLDQNVTLLALNATERIKTESELKELWEEGDAPEWHAAVNDLQERLRQ